MPPNAFYVRRLHVRRLYGLDHDGLVAEALAPGVNVVYGPNGQGKTTLGRALHGLVWPESVREYGPILSGEFSYGGADWTLDLDGTAVRHERDGIVADPPALPGLDERERYRLSLHDLLQSDGTRFSSVVARDAAGGMDLDQAAGALDFSSTTPRASKATRAAEEEWAEVESKRAAQGDLQAEQAALVALRRRRDAAAQAREYTAALALAGEHASARAQADEARGALDALPAALARVRDDDDETLQALRTRGGAAQRDARAAADARDLARARLEANAVERAGHPAPLVELRQLLAVVEEAEDVAHRKNDELAGLRLREAAALADVDGVVDPDQLADADVEAVGKLDGYAEEAARLNALRQESRAVRSVQASATEGAPSADQADAAAEAARALRDWLRSQRSGPAPLPRTLALVGALASAVGAVALALVAHPTALALLVPAVLFAAVYALTRPAPGARAADAQARYRSLDLTDLDWTPGDVETRLVHLEGVQARGAVARVARDYVASWADRIGDVEALAARVEAQGEAVASALGARPGVHGVQLAYAVRTVQSYQEARTLRRAAEAALAAAGDRRRTALVRSAELLAPFELPAPTDAAALAQRLASLDEAAQDAQAARHDHDDAERDQTRAAADAREAATEVRALFDRTGLDPNGGDAAVALAVQSREEFAARAQRASDTEAQVTSALRQLRGHPAYEADLDGLDPETVARRAADAQEVAGEHDDLVRQIAAVEARVVDAQGSHSLEDAVARHRTTLDDLRTVRDQAADARLGQILVDHAARVSQERQVPPVVQRASRLLAQITGHRYALAFDPVARGFLARDAVLGRSFSLDEVSSGTRIQVLLCVRVAFVEHHERGARLPLVLDELLANSDEDRAAAIAEAVLGLCRDGRQVFYLTSQPDEVTKWRRLADACDDVECAFVALGPGVRDPDPNAVPHPALAAAPPAPGGRDHRAYGAGLGVPRWSARDDAGALHLWFAVDDPDALHRALAAGVARLGPALAAARSGAPFGLDEPTVSHLHVYADALAAWQAGWREGRGRPVLRETIEASGAVTPTFLDRVAELAAAVDGDAAALVEALRSGEVSRFRSQSADDLEASLVETGHLDPTPPLDDDALWTLVVARVGADCAAGSPSLADVRAFLGRVAVGPPSPTLVP